MLQQAKLLHLRLGHAPFDKIKMMYPNIDVNAIKNSFFCSICPYARQTGLAFKPSSFIAKFAFKLLHLDTWGPYNTPTLNGRHYFLTVVDDFTRATWTFLLRTKAESFQKLSIFLIFVETQFHTKVKCICFDNAKVFCQGAMLQCILSKV